MLLASTNPSFGREKPTVLLGGVVVVLSFLDCVAEVRHGKPKSARTYEAYVRRTRERARTWQKEPEDVFLQLEKLPACVPC